MHHEVGFIPGMLFSVQFLEEGVRAHLIDARFAASRVLKDPRTGKLHACQYHAITPPDGGASVLAVARIDRTNQRSGPREVLTVGHSQDRPLYRLRAPVEVFGLFRPVEGADPIACSLSQDEILSLLAYGHSLGFPLLPNCFVVEGQLLDPDVLLGIVSDAKPPSGERPN